eukprot:CAMPEP_0184864970 /NCGR_PEP_ID=MMETSP0580-20130426/16519_1 /TAXON_ID=1118495 /ORGANISM="Dactyliosolen fragilissimus" /LENGTH=1213 /DNA_ID=CAMNT_0027363953 /DNA_START=1041 /DNA_END=4682 /DNA_ORIENTATION=-
MGNEHSSDRYSRTHRRGYDQDDETVTLDDRKDRDDRRHKYDDMSSAATFIDNVCGNLIYKGRRGRSYSDDSFSDDETLDSYRPRSGHKKRQSSSSNDKTNAQDDYDESTIGASDSLTMDDSYISPSSKSASDKKDDNDSLISNDDRIDIPSSSAMSKPLASSFAKRCYFTKAGIGKTTQHYEGLTLTGNTVLMLAAAMKLKGCPTICDEDLRRVEQTHPNQFSRLPDELLLSSGWRRISKYCHFSGLAIPDGVPFFHSKERIHPQTGGYYFLLASSVGMERIFEVTPITMDTLIVLQTDYPNQCDQAPSDLIHDPSMWTLVKRFCFFSGGPINTEEDVYYEADLNGDKIYMLAFLSPSLTPEELYRLNEKDDAMTLRTVNAVEQVESIYDLTDRDFDDLRLYHLGPCRVLPADVLNPRAWHKILPNHFLETREKALARAYKFEFESQSNPNDVMHHNNVMNSTPTTNNANGYVEFGSGGTAPGNSDNLNNQPLQNNYSQIPPSQPQQQMMMHNFGPGPISMPLQPSPNANINMDMPLSSAVASNGGFMGAQSTTQSNMNSSMQPPGQSFSNHDARGQIQPNMPRSNSINTSHRSQPSMGSVDTMQHTNDKNIYSYYDPNALRENTMQDNNHMNLHSSQNALIQEQQQQQQQHPQEPQNYVDLQREVEEEGAFVSEPMDEALAIMSNQQDTPASPASTIEIKPDPTGVTLEDMEDGETRNRKNDPPQELEVQNDDNHDQNINDYDDIDSPLPKNRGEEPAKIRSDSPHDEDTLIITTKAGVTSEDKEAKNSILSRSHTDKQPVDSEESDPPSLDPVDQYTDDKFNNDVQNVNLEHGSIENNNPDYDSGHDDLISSFKHNDSLSKNESKTNSPLQTEDKWDDEDEFVRDQFESGKEQNSWDEEAFEEEEVLEEEEALEEEEFFENEEEHNVYNDKSQARDSDTSRWEDGTRSFNSDDNHAMPNDDESWSNDMANKNSFTSNQDNFPNNDSNGKHDEKFDDEHSIGASTLTSTATKSISGNRSVISEYSRSSAMRGAQELLRRNRRKRLERMARQRQADHQPKLENDEDRSSYINSSITPNATSPKTTFSPRSQDHGKHEKWTDETDATSCATGSSVWTDNTNPKERNSRRALILQMAKNRMKNTKSKPGNVTDSHSADGSSVQSNGSSSVPDTPSKYKVNTPRIDEEDFAEQSNDGSNQSPIPDTEISFGASELD